MKYLDYTGLQYFWSKLKALFQTKQDVLVSGTNIKTVNGNSILGNGNIQAGDPDAVKYVSQTLTEIQKQQARANIGAYQKPSSGIPASDIAAGVIPDISGKQDVISDLSAIRSGAAAGATAYQKPSTGIPSTDMASAVQTSLGKADTAYQKPSGGVPKSDLASSVQTSISKADTAIQPAKFNELEEEVRTIGNGAYEEAWDGSSAPVVADIPAGVSVTYNSTSYTGTLTASASTVDKIYLVSDGNGNYDRYTTVEANGAYSWKHLGTTTVQLSDYVTKQEFSDSITLEKSETINAYINTSGNLSNAPDWRTYKYDIESALQSGLDLIAVNGASSNDRVASYLVRDANGNNLSVGAAGVAQTIISNLNLSGAKYLYISTSLTNLDGSYAILYGTLDAIFDYRFALNNAEVAKQISDLHVEINSLDATAHEQINIAEHVEWFNGFISATSRYGGGIGGVTGTSGYGHRYSTPFKLHRGDIITISSSVGYVAMSGALYTNQAADASSYLQAATGTVTIQQDGLYLRCCYQDNTQYTFSADKVITVADLNEEVKDISEQIGLQSLYGKKIAFIGDSITVGYPTPSEGFVAHFQELTGADVQNLGVSGSHLAKIDANDGSSFISRVSQIRGETKMVVIFGGVNDFIHSTTASPFGAFTDGANPSLYTFYAGLHNLFKDLYNNCTLNGMAVVIVTPLHTGSEYSIASNGAITEETNTNGKSFKEYVNAILEVSAFYSFDVVNAYAESSICPELGNTYMGDGLHLNNAGGLKFAKFLIPRLSEILKEFA